MTAELSLIVPIAIVGSALTLVTGFGLATILTPVFLLFFDIKTAVMLVAIVHMANNLMKLRLFRQYIDWGVIKHFGVVSLVGAVIGSLLQIVLFAPGLKVVLGVLLIFLGLKELWPLLERWRIPKKFDAIGGFTSGLVGGLVGNQGAIRSAYLLNYSLNKEAFVASSALIATIVDVARVPIYLTSHGSALLVEWKVLTAATLAALAGIAVGKQFLAHLHLEQFRKIIAGGLMVIGVLFAFRVL